MAKAKTAPRLRTPGIGHADRRGEFYGDTIGLREAKVVAMDLETTGLDWGSRCIGISLAWTVEEELPHSCYISFTDQPDLFGTGIEADLYDFFQELKGKLFVFHYQGFDVRMLFYNYGADYVPSRIVDTAVLASMVDGQESRSLLDLYEKYVSEAPEFVKSQKEDRGRLWLQPPSFVAKYAMWDAVATLQLFTVLHKRMSRVPAYHALWERDIRFTNLVNQLMMRGLPVDREDVERRNAQADKDMDVLRRQVRDETSFISNPNSDDQVLRWIHSHPGQDHVTTTEAEMLGILSGTFPVLAKVIQYRQLVKAKGSWFKDLLQYSKDDGKLHVQLNPFGTRSYRMSAVDLNAQAIPIKPRAGKDGRERAFGGLLGVFKSEREEDILWQYDIKQAEPRWSALLSKDNAVAEIFASGVDPYKAMAKRIWDDERRRQDAKRAYLAALYEIGPRTFSNTNGVSEEDAKTVLNAFRTAFPALRKASYTYSDAVKKNGYVEMFDGRRRYFAADEEDYKGFNQLVQTSVSEHMQLLMLAVEDAFPGRLVLQVHDSLVLYAPRYKAKRQEITDTIGRLINEVLPQEVFERTTPAIRFTVDSESWEDHSKD